MQILQIHNYYRFRGGEDAMFEHICGMLRDHGHQVTAFEKRSDAIRGIGDKIRASVSGVYSQESKQSVRNILKRDNPDLVHIHNLYPLISPSVLEACREFGVPVVMRCPNYRLVCPTGIHLRKGKMCERCAGGKEYWCALTNCRGNLVESTVMAARSYMVRRRGAIMDAVSLFVPPSECVKRKLVEAGIPSQRIHVVPNTVAVPDQICDPMHGGYVGYAGRISEEKGVATLVRAARRLPDVPFQIAGDGPLLASLRKMAPPNVKFLGHITHQAVGGFYASARLSVVPSVWLEAFGLVAAEAMARGLPVVASRMGALPEIVDDGVSGFLFEPGNDAELADRIRRLWDDPIACRAMGRAGREKVRREYDREVYYQRIMDVYEYALKGRRSTSAALAKAARIA